MPNRYLRYICPECGNVTLKTNLSETKRRCKSCNFLGNVQGKYYNRCHTCEELYLEGSKHFCPVYLSLKSTTEESDKIKLILSNGKSIILEDKEELKEKISQICDILTPNQEINITLRKPRQSGYNLRKQKKYFKDVIEFYYKIPTDRYIVSSELSEITNKPKRTTHKYLKFLKEKKLLLIDEYEINRHMYKRDKNITLKYKDDDGEEE